MVVLTFVKREGGNRSILQVFQCDEKLFEREKKGLSAQEKRDTDQIIESMK